MGKNFKNKNNSFNRRTRGQNKPYQKHKFEKPKPNTVFTQNLKEDQVGITEYITKGDGFQGVIKARFSDFHVNEIDLSGDEVRISDLKIPEPIDDGLDNKTLIETKEILSDIITSEVRSSIENILHNSEKDQFTDIDVTECDKEKRTLIHKTLKEEFGSLLITTTIANNDRKFIQCKKSQKGDRIRHKWLWPGEYVYFVIHKENADTVQAASDLARFLKMHPSMVHYAGVKDKRAKTSQRFCVKKREPSEILKSVYRLPYMKVGNFEFKDQVLKLGELKGNRFQIALRHLHGEENVITESLNNLKENGFINYFGLQRFGNCASIPTYKVGLALLKADYKEACELILKPREGDNPAMREARECWWKNRNSALAATMIYNDKFIEKKLLDGLVKYGEHDYATSLRKIPRNMLLLYTHSYQSLVWNKIASMRVKEFGLKLMPGDLVYKDGNQKEIPLDIDVETLIESAEEEVDDKNDEEESTSEPVSKFKTKVRPLSEEDITSGRYTIYDVVLPLPGHDITYPSNVIQKWYEEILGEDGLNSEKLKTNVKTYSLAGAYRKLIVRPENMSWHFKKYKSTISTLIYSDYELLKKNGKLEDEADGDFKALILDFILPASSYATMALREILKSDTSVSNQTMLTKLEENKTEASEENSVGCEISTDSPNSKETDINDHKRKQDDCLENESKKHKLQ